MSKVAYTILNMFDIIFVTTDNCELCSKALDKIKKIKLKENSFGIEPEITIKLAKIKCVFYEVGISYYGRDYEEGKKITWFDGVKAIYCILRYSFFK